MEPYTGLGALAGASSTGRARTPFWAASATVRHGYAAIGAVLLVFSVPFPIAELVAVRAALRDVARARRAEAGWLPTWASSRWSTSS